MHGNKIVQYLQNYKRHEFDQSHSRRFLYSSTSYIQMENTETTRLLSKGSWILPYFWHWNWNNFGYISGKVAKLHFLRKSTEVSQNTPIFILIGPPTTNNGPLKIRKISVFLVDPFSKSKLLTFWIFNESNIWPRFYHI